MIRLIYDAAGGRLHPGLQGKVPVSSSALLSLFTSFPNISCEVHGLSAKTWAVSNSEMLSPHIHGQLLQPRICLSLSPPLCFSTSLISPTTSHWLWSCIKQRSLSQHCFSSGLRRSSQVNFTSVLLALDCFLFSEHNESQQFSPISVRKENIILLFIVKRNFPACYTLLHPVEICKCRQK